MNLPSCGKLLKFACIGINDEFLSVWRKPIVIIRDLLTVQPCAKNIQHIRLLLYDIRRALTEHARPTAKGMAVLRHKIDCLPCGEDGYTQAAQMRDQRGIIAAAVT